MASTLSSDEALARALQEAYEDEFRESSRQRQQQQRPPPTAPPASFADRHSSIEVSDAAYARRVEREMRQEGAFGAASSSSAAAARPNRSINANQYAHRSVNDDQYARRMEQEIADEEVARRISTQEEQRASQHRANVMVAAQPARRGCSVRRVCAYLVPLAVVGAIAIGLLFLFNNPDSLPGFFPDFQDFADEDPFNKTGPEEADRWKTSGKGLTLEVVNALDDRWDAFFNKAVGEWDAGIPDVLTLTTSRREPDPDCSTLNGKMKICNDDYGAKNWRGINQVLIRGGFIFASTAKMNDFYLKKSGDSQKQYTMCHEVGHGFGLPHTDVNFYNADTGECMDYTENPENNDQPGADNFEFLQVMYGNVAGDDSSTAAAASTTVPGKRKMTVVDDADEALPEWLDFKLQEIMPGFENRVDGNEHEDGWRLLHRSLHGAGHEMDLGDGYSVRVHKLLVSELE